MNGEDFWAAYAPGVKCTGAVQTVALLESDSYYAFDAAINFDCAGVTPVPIETVRLDGYDDRTLLTSKLTFTPAATAKDGSYSVTVRGVRAT